MMKATATAARGPETRRGSRVAVGAVFVAVSLLGSCATDETPAVVDSVVEPVDDTSTDTEPPPTTETPTTETPTTETPTTAEDSAAAKQSATRFRDLVRNTEKPLLELYELLEQPVVPEEQMETLRASLCSPDFQAPDRTSVETNMALYIRGTAQSNDALARRWLAEGILTEYERVDGENGLFTVNIVWDDDVLRRLADASMTLIETVPAAPEVYCVGADG